MFQNLWRYPSMHIIVSHLLHATNVYSYTNIIKYCTTKELKTGHVDLFCASFKTSTNAHRMETDVMITPIVPTTMDRLLVLAKMASREMDLFVLVINFFSFSYFYCSSFHYFPFCSFPLTGSSPYLC